VAARVDAFRECPQRLVPVDSARPFPCHVAAADVHVHGLPSVEALLEEPVGFGRSGLFAAPSFGLASFFVCDPPTGAREVGLLDSFEEAEQVEPRRGRIVHLFECRR